MNISEFWKIIEKTKSDDQATQERLLHKELMPLEKQEIIDFHNIFDNQTCKLHGLTYNNDCGRKDCEECKNTEWCERSSVDIGPLGQRLKDFGHRYSEDDFGNFLVWIVASGKQIFRAALVSPTTFEINFDQPYAEGLFYIAGMVLEEKFDLDIFESFRQSP